MSRLSEIEILKRSYNYGSERAILYPKATDIDKHLGCRSAGRRTSSRRAVQTMERWVHREFVEGLRRIGEFRVFITTV